MANNNSGRDKNEKDLVCSFCGKHQDEVERMIIGPGVNICSECIGLCHDLLSDKPDQPKSARPARGANRAHIQPADDLDINILTPAEIKEGLDQYVIGQDEAKRVLAVSVYNHYKRILSGKGSDVELQKSNVLLLGPSGVGKTLLAQTLAKMLGVPFAIADATTLTEAGYVGEDVENILLKLIQAADFDVQKAQIGIIYIDEIDKIAGKGNQNGADVSREGVQRDILPIVEGSTVVTKYGPVKTDFILFIAAGAFHVSSIEDLIPELQGRFPVSVELQSLTKEDFVRILTETENSLTFQYKQLLGVDNIDLCFDDTAIERIAEISVDLNATSEDIGARRLHTVMEYLLEDISFNAGGGDYPTVTLNITGQYVEEHLSKLTGNRDLKKYVL